MNTIFRVVDQIVANALAALEEIDQPTWKDVNRAAKEATPNMSEHWLSVLVEHPTWAVSVVETPARTNIIEMVEALTVVHVTREIAWVYETLGREIIK